MSQDKRCINCGNIISGHNSQTKKYCSRECWLSYKAKKRSACLNCGKIISSHNWKYCSQECMSEHRGVLKNREINEIWESGNFDKWVVKKGPSSGEIMPHIKEKIIKPLLLEEQNHLCAICGMIDNHNKMPLTFILDHIDGDWANNTKNNFRLICPNCNSQLSTTRNNRGRGRYSAKLYQKIHRDNLNK